MYKSFNLNFYYKTFFIFVIAKCVLSQKITYGGEMGIRTPETALTVYTISNRAPSANSDTSP